MRTFSRGFEPHLGLCSGPRCSVRVLARNPSWTRIGLYTQGFEPGEDPSDIEDPNSAALQNSTREELLLVRRVVDVI